MIPIFLGEIDINGLLQFIDAPFIPIFFGERVNELNLRLILLQEPSTGTRSEGLRLCLAKLPSLGRFWLGYH